jgi:hypothetical protein
MGYVNLSLVAYVLKASLRDKLVISVFAIFCAAISLALFLGSAAVIETGQVVLTFTAGSIRIIGVIALTLFTVFYVRRCFDTHDVEYLLSRPVSRISFVLSHLLGLAILCMGFAVIACGAIYIASAGQLDSYGFGLWGVSFLLEMMIIVYAAFFFSMVLSSAVSGTLATFSGYILARMSGQVLGIIDSGTHGGEQIGLLEGIMQGSSVIVPRFDLYTQSAWLIYGPDQTIAFGYIVISGLAFLLLITCAAIWDLIGRDF